MQQTGKAQVSTQCPVPSQAQLALAIAIVNSKSANISVIDHIQQIRLHIKQSPYRLSSQTSSSDKYFDSVAFWKQAYTKAEDAQSKLNDRIYELEQRVETLKLKLKQEDKVCTPPENGKRKECTEPSVSESQRKRAKTNQNSSEISANSEIDLDDLNEMTGSQVSDSEMLIRSVIRYISVLQQNLQKRPNWVIISSSAVELCKAAGSIFPVFYRNTPSKISKSTKIDRDCRAPNPMVISGIVEAAHTLLCRALDKITNSTEGTKYEGQLIYHMVCFFEKAICAIGKLCDLQATNTMALTTKHTQRDNLESSMQRSSSDSSRSSLGGASPNEASETLRRVIASMMLKATTLRNTTQNSLFEGYVYVFLNRVGTVLSVLEFQGLFHRLDLQANPEKLPLPNGLSRAEFEERFNSNFSPIVVYELESYHLVWLLEKAIALVHSISMKYSQYQDSNITGDSAQVAIQNSSAGLLLHFTKKKLQCTLLKAVFHEDESLFLDSLRKPQYLSCDEPKSGMNKKGESASEWFTREVWRLLGWDILESIWKCGKNNRTE